MCSCCDEYILCALVVMSVFGVVLLWWVYFVCSCCDEFILCVLVVLSVFCVFLL